MKAKKRIIIIDGNALVHRAFHAIPLLTNKKGVPTNAVYGFVNILFKVIKELKPTHVAITYDLPGGSFRNEKFKEYKANRKKQPDELYQQIPLTEEIVAALDFPVYTKKGFEADDVIGTLCRDASIDNDQVESIVVTGDMDTLQLVDHNTKVFTMKRGINDTILYGPKEVEQKFRGLKPGQIIDYKALRGDPSDNIPGVRGIGEKGAIDLINEFKTLEDLYKAVEEGKADGVRDRIKNLLIEHKKDAEMSKELATIKLDVPVDFDFERCEVKGIDETKVFEVFQKFEFNRLVQNISEIQKIYGSTKSDNAEEVKEIEHKYVFVNNKKQFQSFVEELKKQKEFAIDTETNSVDAISASLVGMSFSWKEAEAYYIDTKTLEDNSELTKKLQGILENPEMKKTGHNIKYDLNVLKRFGIDLQGINFDTMIAAYILNAGSRNLKLDQLAFTEFGHKMIPIEEIIGKGKDQITMDQVDPGKVAEYAAEDADYTWRLKKKLEQDLKKQGLEEVFQNIEIPLIEVLAYMERNGIEADQKKLETLKKKFTKKIKELEEAIFKIAGHEFNVKSPKQLQEVLFEELDIPTYNLRKTKTGISTAASELEKLRGDHEIIDLISQHREYSKLVHTYIEALPKLLNQETQRIHTSFNQVVTATGRLSSSDPNLQNIPIRTENGQEIRGCFRASKGFSLVAIDYSQFELRIVATLAKDKNMLEIFKNGGDFHAETASKIYDVPLEGVQKEMRYAAKAVNFGVLYGMGVYGLAQSVQISREEASEFIGKYFELFGGVKEYLERTKQEAREKGYVETLFGRRRYIPEIHSGMAQVRKSAERMAINMPVQGTAADLMKMAMNDVYKVVKNEKAVKVLLQVHDELVFEVQEGKEKEWTKKLKKIMEEVHSFEVPIIVDAKIGDNWQDLRKMEV